MKLMYIAIGGSSHTRKWVEYFRDAGSKVLLVSFYPCQPIAGVEVRVLKCRNRASMLMKLPRVKKLIAEFQPDILHAHYASSCGLVGALTGFRPFVLSTWGDDIMVFPHKSPLHRLLVSWVIKKADYVTATGAMLGRHTEALTNGTKDVQVISFGVDIERFSVVKRQEHKVFQIGAVRNLMPKYGLEYLIRATARLIAKNHKVHLTLIGPGYLRTKLESLCRELGIQKEVTFTGELPNEEMHKCMARFDLVVMPSVSAGETFGVSAVEAMATGLPVIASDIGGLPEVVSNGKTGRLVKPADVTDLFESLKYYIENPDIRLEHGRAGRRRVEELFDWQANALEMKRVYELVLNRKRPADENRS